MKNISSKLFLVIFTISIFILTGCSTNKNTLTIAELSEALVVDMQSADMNGDGRLDIILSRTKETCSFQAFRQQIHEQPGHSDGNIKIESNSDTSCSNAKNDDTIILPNSANGPHEVQAIPISNNTGSPAEITLQDIDGDGDLDIIVGIIGNFAPINKKIGKVLIIENILNKTTNTSTYFNHIVEEKSFRVVKSIGKDLDGDGDIDLLVAAFGGFSLGDMHWLENKGNWTFISHYLSDLNGALGIVDISSMVDYEYPFIAFLVSQDHESVIAFNFSSKHITQTLLYKVDNIEWGSNKLAEADIDFDGDIDIVWSNGDDELMNMTYEFHGINWLEQKNGQFIFHEVGKLRGVINAIPADFDGDGDQDIITSRVFGKFGLQYQAPIGWFENIGNGTFKNYTPLSNHGSGVLGLTTGDYDNDGDLDIVYQDIITLKIQLIENKLIQ